MVRTAGGRSPGAARRSWLRPARARHAAPRRRRPLPLLLAGAAAVLTLAAFAAFPGAGSYAMWNGAATSDAGTVTGGTVSVTASLAPSLAYTFRSGQTAITGGVTVTDTGTVGGTVSAAVALGAASSAALARAIRITVWAAPGVASCTTAATVPSGAYTSSLSAAAGIPLGLSIAPGATAAYCVRSAMDPTSAAGIASGSAVALTITSVLTAGSWTSSAPVSATQSFVDDLAPGVPTLTLTSSTAVSASLSFSATDNVGVAGYAIARDGKALATVPAPATTYTDTALPPGAHTYTVTAVDAAGNVSAASTAVAVSAPIVPTSWYQVVSAATGLCAAVPASGLTTGTAVGQSACASTAAAGGQAWRLPAATAAGTVASALPSTTAPQYYWSAAGSTTNAVVQAGTSATQTRAQWTPAALANGLFRFTIVPNGTGTALCLDAGTGGQLQATTCSATSVSQQFTLAAVTP